MAQAALQRAERLIQSGVDQGAELLLDGRGAKVNPNFLNQKKERERKKKKKKKRERERERSKQRSKADKKTKEKKKAHKLFQLEISF